SPTQTWLGRTSSTSRSVLGNAPEEALLASLGAPVLPRAFASDVGTSHEAGNPALANALALLDKDVADPRAAVGVQALRMKKKDARSQAVVFKLARQRLV